MFDKNMVSNKLIFYCRDEVIHKEQSDEYVPVKENIKPFPL